MHYANGRAAKVGDVVRGKGYNIKHEIIGLLISASPESTACNCTVACVTKPLDLADQSTVSTPVYVGAMLVDGKLEQMPSSILKVEANHEYGQLDAFVALDPKTGEVLPPEETPAPAA